MISFIYFIRQFEIDILTAEQQIEEANHSLRETIVSNNMTKIQETQSCIEMVLEAKKISSSQLEELKSKKQKLNYFLPVPDIDFPHEKFVSIK